ncbi:MAG: hypothetical protein M9958_04950 [Chitinophagales bacterium]|nr:hypothetical protein [Chitinophagales bacterium]
MNTQTLNNKNELIQWLSTLDDDSIIEKLLKFKEEETKDWWDTISEEERKSIEKGISDADNNKVEPHSSIRKIYDKWL